MFVFKSLLFSLVFFASALSGQYYNVEIESTGETQLTILSGTISSLDIGDEIGIYDANGVVESCLPPSFGGNCNPFTETQYGEVLVGAAVWNGEQISIPSIKSVNQSGIGGPILNGAVEGNPVVIKVYKNATSTEYSTSVIFQLGTGSYGDLFQIVSEISLEGFDGVVGCTDSDACNYNPDATINGECVYSEENFDCDGNCVAEIDCNGECGGSAEDLGCGCGEAGPVVLCEDTDGDGFGNPGTQVQDCGEGGSQTIADGCDLPSDNIYLGADGTVYYNSSSVIGGFQFTVDGATVSGASGGDAASGGFTVQPAGSTVLAFSFTGGTFGPGCGVMTNLTLNGAATGLSSIVVSNAVGGSLGFTYYVPTDDVDLVSDCSDVYPDCADNFYDCNDECGGSAVVDECGECGGDGIADGECDCDGSIDLGCGCGEAGPVVLCEDTDGDGFGNPGSEVEECADGGRDVTDGCDLPSDNIYLGADGTVYYNSSSVIGGFQFTVDGATVSGASGGDAASGGFTVQPAGSTVLAFSFTGGTFGPGCGVMTNLTLNGAATGLSSIVVSNAVGGSLGFTYYVPTDDVDLVSDCSDVYPDCADNFYDCNDECGGSAVVDECGECGGDGIADGECDCDGSVDLGCGCGEAGPSGCDNQCGSTLEFDECGECGGDGPSAECWDGSLECSIDDCSPEPVDNFYVIDLENQNTGASQLTIFNSSITSLEVGDEIGVFDANGVLEDCIPPSFGGDCNPFTDTQYGEVLVGSAVWEGGQLSISSIMSVNQSAIGGPVLNGAVQVILYG